MHASVTAKIKVNYWATVKTATIERRKIMQSNMFI